MHRNIYLFLILFDTVKCLLDTVICTDSCQLCRSSQLTLCLAFPPALLVMTLFHCLTCRNSVDFSLQLLHIEIEVTCCKSHPLYMYSLNWIDVNCRKSSATQWSISVTLISFVLPQFSLFSSLSHRSHEIVFCYHSAAFFRNFIIQFILLGTSLVLGFLSLVYFLSFRWLYHCPSISE